MLKSQPTWSLQDAKNRFSAVVDAALTRAPQWVTRRGVPAVVVLSVSEYERLAACAGGTRGAFAQHLLAIPQDEARDTPDEDDLPRADAIPRDIVF